MIMNTKHFLAFLFACIYISGCDVSDSVAVNTTDTCKIKFWMVRDSLPNNNIILLQEVNQTKPQK
jgi:hypothetical protein